MAELIHRAAAWLLTLLAPGTGIHRAGHRPTPPKPTLPPNPRLPLHRSPYGLDHPLDGAATRLVRPYLQEVAA